MHDYQYGAEDSILQLSGIQKCPLIRIPAPQTIRVLHIEKAYRVNVGTFGQCRYIRTTSVRLWLSLLCVIQIKANKNRYFIFAALQVHP